MASTFQLSSMILPQLENKSHGVEVVGMMFFDDNLYVLAKVNFFGEEDVKGCKRIKYFINDMRPMCNKKRICGKVILSSVALAK